METNSKYALAFSDVLGNCNGSMLFGFFAKQYNLKVRDLATYNNMSWQPQCLPQLRAWKGSLQWRNALVSPK